jgi:hypothetical protein
VEVKAVTDSLGTYQGDYKVLNKYSGKERNGEASRSDKTAIRKKEGAS